MRNSRGFALIDLIFVCGIIGTLAIIAMPRMLLAKQSAGAASAIGSLRTINSGELTFAITCGSGFYAPTLTALGTPPTGTNDAYISPQLATSDSVLHSGYLLRVEGTPYDGSPASCNGLESGETARGFKAGANPSLPGATRFFASNSNMAIFEHTSSLWETMPENGESPRGHPLQ
jgi:type II secretory pathway pseudopilin PulG